VTPAERGGRWPVAAPLDLTPTILGRPALVTGHGELLDQQPPAFASGRYRFLYEVDDGASVVYIINIGRIS